MGVEQKKGEQNQRFKKRRSELGQGIDALKKGRLESPYETMMFTSTFLQDFFIYFYLLFISHCSLLFCNNIAMHCKMFYANPSQQLHTTKTNYKVLHREKLQASN